MTEPDHFDVTPHDPGGVVRKPALCLGDKGPELVVPTGWIYNNVEGDFSGFKGLDGREVYRRQKEAASERLRDEVLGCVCDEINMRHCPVHGQGDK